MSEQSHDSGRLGAPRYSRDIAEIYISTQVGWVRRRWHSHVRELSTGKRALDWPKLRKQVPADLRGHAASRARLLPADDSHVWENVNRLREVLRERWPRYSRDIAEIEPR